jgi:ABC-2 type transport system permease protein
MAGTLVVFRKELADNLGSKRYLTLFLLILLLGSISAYQGAEFIKDNPGADFVVLFSGSGLGYSFVQLMALFGPILGLALGFDAINKERSSGTLITLLSRPIFRDSIFTGKLLAGISAVCLLVLGSMVIMSGIAIPLVGFGPTIDQAARIIILTMFTMVYLAFWLGLGLLFSVLIKKTSTSILAAIVVWLFFVIVIPIGAVLVADSVTPLPVEVRGEKGFDKELYLEILQERATVQNSIMLISPSNIYTKASSNILSQPITGTGVIGGGGIGKGSPFRDLTIDEGLSASWAHVTVILVGLIIFLAISYAKFLRQEIRGAE